MLGLQVNIIEYVDDGFPGYVRCTFTDIDGVEWSVIEKSPVVSKEYLDKSSISPREGIIAGLIKNSFFNDENEEIISFDTELPWGVVAENGETLFAVKRSQLIEFDQS